MNLYYNAVFIYGETTGWSLPLYVLLVIRQQLAVKYKHLAAFQSAEPVE